MFEVLRYLYCGAVFFPLGFRTRFAEFLNVIDYMGLVCDAPTEEEILQYIEDRNEARKAGDYARADMIRDELKQRGVVLMDEKGAKGNFRGNQVTKWRYWRP